MPPFVSELIGQLKNIWAQLSGSQRVTVAAVIGSTIVGLAALVWLGTRPEYVPFGNHLEGEDRSAAIQALEESNVDFRLENEVLKVNARDLSDAEKTLVKKRLLRGDGGGSSSMLGGLSTDKETRRWELQRQQARQIERQIRGLDGVQGAILSFHQPEPSDFLGRSRESSETASVLITVRAPEEFDQIARRVLGIVASGLGIPRKNVEVVSDDLQGYREASEMGGDGYGTLLRLQDRAARTLATKARMFLEKNYPGKTWIAVHVEYDNKVVQRHKKIISEDKIIVEESSYDTTDSQGGRGARGDPNGVGGIGGATAMPTVSGDGSKSTVKQTKKVYDPVLGEETYQALAPDLQRVNVSLSIDESLAAKKTEIEEQVKRAVGWKDTRDPPLTAMVVTMPELDYTADVGGGFLTVFKEHAPIVGQVLAVLFVLLFLRGLLRRARPPVGAPATALATEEREEDPSKQARRLRRDIEKVVAQDPASVSRLLESWLSGSREM